jgi:glycosyltransferase involved in cell wall biosynthesis
VQPLVSFVVPCFKLGHLLAECVTSILAQTHQCLEVLIMDDASPDDTPAIARSFTDPRVRYVRNENNIGHLQNYNKGIRLARGKYLWLISADDSLRRPYAVERLVSLLEADPSVSLAFCPGVKVTNGVEGTLFGPASLAEGTVSGSRFVCSLVNGNFVAAPGALTRRECYERAGLFPLDLPYAGDWYLWCSLALQGNVAFCGEPLVNYRVHELSMTHQRFVRDGEARAQDEIEVRWRVMSLAQTLRFAPVVRECKQALARDYALRIYRKEKDSWFCGITEAQYAASLESHATAVDARLIDGLVKGVLGDLYHQAGEVGASIVCYQQSLTSTRSLPVFTKLLLARCGVGGRLARHSVSAARTLYRRVM